VPLQFCVDGGVEDAPDSGCVEFVGHGMSVVGDIGRKRLDLGLDGVDAGAQWVRGRL
jgi:hypothetical protein